MQACLEAIMYYTCKNMMWKADPSFTTLFMFLQIPIQDLNQPPAL